MPRFLIHHPTEGSRVFELLGDRPIVVGRAKSSNLVLDNASISRQHAVVRETPDGRWQIIDRGAINGVKVNGTLVKEAFLRANDEIILGEYRLRYFEDSAERGFTMLLDRDSIGRGDFSKGGYGFEPALIRYRSGSKASPDQGAPQLTISQSIIRQVMHGGLPLLVSDPQADPRLAASQSIAISGIQSAMCAPLGTKEVRLGLLYVDNLSRRGMFTVEDLNVFTVIATQAGLAIDRARPKEEPAEQPQPSPALT